MGFFDVFRSRTKPPATPRHPGPSEKAESADKAAVTLSAEKLSERLAEAQQLLEKKNPEAAVRIFEQLLATAGDQGEVLEMVSNELGKNGLIDKIIELVGPRYAIDRHGPGTGMNLLQAYLVLGDSVAAGLMLAKVSALKRPELKQRLDELGSLLKDLIEAERSGQVPTRNAGNPEPVRVSLVSISKPIWFYGLEALAEKLLPPKNAQARRVAFAQLSLIEQADIGALMGQPEEELGRLCRALPLWFAETLYFSPSYTSIAALGILEDKQRGSHYALFPAEWTEENLRQLIETNKEPLDYIITGSLKRKEGDTEMTIRLWEVKKLKERKTFTVRWTPSTMDAQLTQFHELLRTFMECIAYPAGQGLPYTPAAVPSAWLDTLGASLSLFLAEKGVIPTSRIRTAIDDVEKASARAAAGHAASLAWITLRKRATFLGFKVPAQTPVLASHPLVSQALELKG